MSTGKRAVVTGGANGIGQAFCKRLAAQGANIVIADIADCSETVGAIKKSGGTAITVRCDQTSEADVARLRATVENELGGCDILVHCAGIYPTAAIDEITFDQWRKVLSVNLDSVFLLVKAFLPAMKEQRWGRIISVSSTTFHSGIGFNTHYTASKGGLIGFARSLASEVGDFGITVNTIAPGLTRTDTTVNGKPGEFGWFDMIREQQAIKRTETPEDLTGTLAFLASEDAAFITGQTSSSTAAGDSRSRGISLRIKNTRRTLSWRIISWRKTALAWPLFTWPIFSGMLGGEAMAYIFKEGELPSLISVVPGRERIFFVNQELANIDDMLAGVMHYKKGAASPLHLHKNCEHFYFIISGKATVESDEGIRPVGPGDLIFIPAEEKHRLRATEPLFYFEFQAPNRFKTTILEGTDDDLRWERKDGRVWVQT